MNQEKLYPLVLTEFTASANLGTGVHAPPQPSQYCAGFEREFIRENYRFINHLREILARLL